MSGVIVSASSPAPTSLLSHHGHVCVHRLLLINDPSLLARCVPVKINVLDVALCMSRERTCQGTYSSLTAASGPDDLGGGQGSVLNSSSSADQKRRTRFRTHQSLSLASAFNRIFNISKPCDQILAYRQMSIGSALKKSSSL